MKTPGLLVSALACALVSLAPAAPPTFFELNAKLACDTPNVSLHPAKSSFTTPELIQTIMQTDADTAALLALVYDSSAHTMFVARRCDALNEIFFATTGGQVIGFGPPSNGREKYLLYQTEDLQDWFTGTTSGTVNCKFSGDANSANDGLITAHGSCAGSVQRIDGPSTSFCQFKATVKRELVQGGTCAPKIPH
jgi:hypothetical protein